MKNIIATSFLSVAFTAALAFAKDTGYQAPLFNNLGNFHYPISTKVPMAQRFFNQGLILFYGFEWGESARSFKEATRLDPHCAMCYWGQAFALLYKINAPENKNDLLNAKAAIDKALALATSATTKENDVITALANRFQQAQSVEKKSSGFSCHKSTDGNQDATLTFIDALKKLSKKYPDDNEIKVWYALGMFWGVYQKTTYKDPRIIETINLLKTILNQDPLNIGANHYAIHFIEPTPQPEVALPSADRFHTLVPGSEHLVHMPAHIYYLTGRYHQATLANINATKVYLQYNQDCKQQGFAPEINYLYFHNYDFLRSTAIVEGRKALALSAAQQIVQPPFSAWLKNSADLQWFIPIPYYVQARFGLWDQLSKEHAPNRQYQYALGMWHYARGLSLLHQHKDQNALNELSALNDIIQKNKVQSLLGQQGKSLLEIAREILAATIDDAHHFLKNAEAHLKIAIVIQDNLGYHEPPDWYFPAREALADFYLHNNKPRQAKEMYQLVLKQYPAHPWALYGLWQALSLLSDKDTGKIHQQYLTNWKFADIPHPILLF